MLILRTAVKPACGGDILCKEDKPSRIPPLTHVNEPVFETLKRVSRVLGSFFFLSLMVPAARPRAKIYEWYHRDPEPVFASGVRTFPLTSNIHAL